MKMKTRMPKVNRGSESGAAIIEFSFVSLSLIPLMLGVGVVGIDMIRAMQTVQLARDAAHLFARGLDVSEPGNQMILANIGVPLGLSATPGAGSAELVFTALTYVDNAACAEVGAVDGSGNPSGCTNLGRWVFAQRLIVGNSSLVSSSIGTPLAGGPTGVTVDPTTGMISVSDYVLQAGAVATFNLINPYANVNGTISGLPSGQFLYICEAASTAYTLPPFINTATLYSYGIF
jgi:hypothetical protein